MAPTTGQIDPDDPCSAAVGAASITVGVPGGPVSEPDDAGTVGAVVVVDAGSELVLAAVGLDAAVRVAVVRETAERGAVVTAGEVRKVRLGSDERPAAELGRVVDGWVVARPMGAVFVARTLFGLKLGVVVPPNTQRSTLPDLGLYSVAPVLL